MSKEKKKLTKYYFMSMIFFTILFASLQGLSEAADVAGVKGALNHKNTVTITGSGFGAMEGSIVTWDDFEAQTVGAHVEGSSPILGPDYYRHSSPDTDPIIFTNKKAHGGSKAVFIDWIRSTINAFGWKDQGPYTKLYITYWNYMRGDYDPDYRDANGGRMNHKQFYIFGSTTDPVTNEKNMPNLIHYIPAGIDLWCMGDNSNHKQNDGNNCTSWTYSDTRDRWNRWEVWTKLNDKWDCTADVDCNAEVKFWLNAKLGRNRSDYKQRWVNDAYRRISIGVMAQRFMSTAETWFDDLYISTTQARVEIGNASTWSACTHREIQIPVSWSNNMIDIQVNNGSFSSAQKVYLYVVDAKGNVNEQGLPITLGTVSDQGDTVSPASFPAWKK